VKDAVRKTEKRLCRINKMSNLKEYLGHKGRGEEWNEEMPDWKRKIKLKLCDGGDYFDCGLLRPLKW